jgi:16S rRNA (cytosine967-C5)-methyltransferase
MATDPDTEFAAPPVPRDIAPVRLGGGARQLALQLYGEARAEWAYTTDIIARAFRTNRQLSSGDRRRIAETVYGLIRWDRRLEAIATDLLSKNRRARETISQVGLDELRLVLHELREGVPLDAVKGDVKRLFSAGTDIDLGGAIAEDAGLAGRSGLDREATRLSYSTWMLERFVNDLGEAEALALADAMNRRAPMAIRTNTARISRETLVDRLREEAVTARPTPLSPTGLVLETRVNAFGLAAFRDGLFEVMDEGSQLVAEAVAPPPRGRVVDACAGAGGKTLALAALMEGQGRILALDNKGKKLEELRRRARRAGLSNVVAREVSGPDLPPEARPASWDRVLVDAPCSGVGTLRRNPEARWRLEPKIVDSFHTRQLALMVTYAPLVAVGGRLVYATCTVLRDENEEVIERFIAERPDFVVVPLKEIWGKPRALELGDGTFLRLFPHRHDTDGFFAATLRRVR